MTFTGTFPTGDGRIATIDAVGEHISVAAPADDYGQQLPMTPPYIGSNSWWNDPPDVVTITALWKDGKAAGYPNQVGFAYHNDDFGHVSIGRDDVGGAVTFLPKTSGSSFWTTSNPYYPSGCVLGQASYAGCVQYATGSQQAAQTYYDYSRHNFRYFYPAHDHLPPIGAGDYFTAMLPGVGFSVGASGTELAMLDLYFRIAAALRPNVQAKLIEQGRLWGVVDVIWRMAWVGLNPAAYATGPAHMVAWQSVPYWPDAVKYANSITVDKIPPASNDWILSEDYQVSDQKWTVPDAVSRYHSDAASTHSITLLGEAEFATGAVTHRWVLLRGDPKRVRFTPLTADGSKVKIAIDYPQPFQGPFGPAPRIDILYYNYTDIQFPSQPSYLCIYGARQ